MKKTFLFLSFCVLLISVNIFAESKNSAPEQEKYFAMAKVPPLTDFKYELTDDLEGVKITGYKGKDIHVLIPDSIEDTPVVELGTYAFRDRKKMETVVMPDTVKTVGDNLFYNCTALKQVKLSTALKSIKDSMFSGCEALEEFNIPDHITNIEGGAFMHSGLKSIYIPDTVISFLSKRRNGIDQDIYSFIFSGCRNLESVRLPASMTIIPDYMFSRCTALSNIILPNGITEIGKLAFEECESLTHLDIPAAVTAIRKGAFDNTGLQSLTIPDSVTVLECSFGTCKHLETLRLPDTLTEITDSLFHGVLSYSAALKSVNLPASLQKISEGAFTDLSNLHELIIPDSIESLEFLPYSSDGDSNAFTGTSLTLKARKRLKQLGYPGKL